MEDKGGMGAGVKERHVSDLDLARAPASFGSLKHVYGRIRYLGGRGCLGLGWLRRFNSPGRRRRQQLLLCLFHSREIRANDSFRIAVCARDALVQPERLVAKPFDEVQRMGDQQDGFAAPPELGKLVQALVCESFVTDCQHLIDKQHVGVDVDGNRKAEAHVHARGVSLDRRIDEFLQLCKLDDRVETMRDLAFRQTEHDTVDKDVLPARDLRVKAGTELDERGDAAVDANRATRRLRDAGDKLQCGALTRPIGSNHAVGRSFRNAEGDVLQSRKRLARFEVPQDAALQYGALERGELPAAVTAKDLRYVNQLDRGRHTASANESRRRSKNQYAPRNMPIEAAPRASNHFQWP